MWSQLGILRMPDCRAVMLGKAGKIPFSTRGLWLVEVWERFDCTEENNRITNSLRPRNPGVPLNVPSKISPTVKRFSRRWFGLRTPIRGPHGTGVHRSQFETKTRSQSDEVSLHRVPRATETHRCLALVMADSENFLASTETSATCILRRITVFGRSEASPDSPGTLWCIFINSVYHSGVWVLMYLSTDNKRGAIGQISTRPLLFH